MDISNNINLADAAYYQSLIEYLRWIVELDWSDTAAEVSITAPWMDITMKGHLGQL